MKKLIALTTLLASTAFASSTATLQLNGVIASAVSISLDTTSSQVFDLTNGETDALVATATEISNSNTGYVINVASVNNGAFVSTSDSNFSVNYTMKYDGQTLNLASGSDTVDKSASTGVVNNQSPITISYTGVPAVGFRSGTYQDTVTLEIVAN